MEKRKSDRLLKKYLKGEASAEENALIETWFLEETKSGNEEFAEPDYQQVKGRLWARIGEQNKFVKPARSLWPKVIFAAAAILIAGVCIFLFSNKTGPEIKHSNSYVNDIGPGSNKAVLTLSNGTKISLSDAGNGKLADQAGISITKNNGKLVYELKESGANGKGGQGNLTNTISTPKGGQYQINLPDGTKVWLNSASSLKFPPGFKGLKERRVELEGEAYFEVFKDKESPFKVVSKNQTVQVFGTHFNINSYANEENTKTTLLEGSVCVSVHSGSKKSEQRFLKPGQQSSLNPAGKMEVGPANIDHVMAWKNGYFHFERDNLTTVMNQLERWYNVEVVNQTQNSDDEFVGDIPRSVNLSEVLKILEYGGVHFKIEGRKIIVTK